MCYKWMLVENIKWIIDIVLQDQDFTEELPVIKKNKPEVSGKIFTKIQICYWQLWC